MRDTNETRRHYAEIAAKPEYADIVNNLLFLNK